MVPLPTPYEQLLCENRDPYHQYVHGTLRSNCINGMVAINRLCLSNTLSNASIANPPLPQQTAVLTPPQILGLQIAAKLLPVVTVDSL